MAAARQRHGDLDQEHHDADDGEDDQQAADGDDPFGEMFANNDRARCGFGAAAFEDAARAWRLGGFGSAAQAMRRSSDMDLYGGHGDRLSASEEFERKNRQVSGGSLRRRAAGTPQRAD
ncbi:MAG: hypothetical protein U5O69_07495 [Candidatus Competibacteraceae bacterium]|nr:hypothetical protein [Candidatus Competibacteraceae bacterium]